jgi:inorganic pyrophosphatase
MHQLNHLDAYADDDVINTVIETPRGSRNKFKYQPDLGLFTLHKVLPPGTVFPYDFGFIPSTLGDDGDPLDVLLLMDEAAPTGCIVRARLIGIIEAEQTEDGKTVRNHRVLAVASACHGYCETRTLGDLPPELLDGIEHFFVAYNDAQGRQFKPLGRRGPRKAQKLIDEGIQRAQKARKRKKAARR